MHRLIAIICLVVSLATAQAAAVVVGNNNELSYAVASAGPGTTILVRPGVYAGGLFFGQVHGSPAAPIVLAGADPNNPPVLRGGDGAGIHLTETSHIEIRNFIIEGAKYAGINIDDGQTLVNPSHHIALRQLAIRNVGDCGIKLAGVDSFIVQSCVVDRWGADLPGINMVGCHRGVVVGCLCRHDNPPATYGAQAKGGSESIVFRGCRFEQVGNRGINVGGSTGMPYFRPSPQGFEARNVRVEDCTFVGGAAAVSFVNADNCVARFNTIYRPSLWPFRILQETTEPGFVPCRNCQVTDNIIAFRSDEVQEYVNVGPDTLARSFTFARNWWYCLDVPSLSVPVLPVREADGVYGIDPLFVAHEQGDLRLTPESPASAVGVRPRS